MTIFGDWVLFVSAFNMIFKGVLSVIAIYIMYLAIKSLKIYINKNS